MTARIRRIRFLPNAFATLTRVVVLCVLVGLAGASAAHAHQTEAYSPVAAQASEVVSLEECCHGADQGARQTECALTMCCSFSALVGYGGRDMPPAAASLRRLIGPLGFSSRSHPPVLHPPIAI